MALGTSRLIGLHLLRLYAVARVGAPGMTPKLQLGHLRLRGVAHSNTGIEEGTNVQNTIKRTLGLWADEYVSCLDVRTRALMRLARWDLMYGPIEGDDAGEIEYPGFAPAVAELRNALDIPSELYIDTQCESWAEIEPEDYIDGDIYRVDAKALKRALLGELADYI